MKTLRRISRNRAFTHARILAAVLLVLTAAALVFLAVSPHAVAQPTARMRPLTPKFLNPVAFDVSPPFRSLVHPATPLPFPPGAIMEVRPERPRTERVQAHRIRPYRADGARQLFNLTPTIPNPLLTFEGMSNQDNFNIFGGRVNPPDTVGDVGPNHYVEMINLVFAVDKAGNLLMGPVDTGSLWAGFPIEDCTDPSGDPVVLYDQTTDHWILSQFTTRGLDAQVPNYNCVAVSQTGDPTGAYYRYAFSTQADDVDGGYFFPDYPKYGVWSNSYILTTRDFGWVDRYGISVYALEKNKMVNGVPNARAVQFFLEANVTPSGTVPLELVGDGLLPPDMDGNRRPIDSAPAPIVGTQDDAAGYGATIDAINIWELSIKWSAHPTASMTFAAQLPTAPFDSIYPCAPDSRDCLPQPGIVNPAQYLDILSSRQRPTYRLAYRNFNTYESLVTNQSVEAAPGVAGARWYEIRRTGSRPPQQTAYSIHQQGTYAPGDGVHRWMGSIAQDKNGNMALGYSVVNGIDVFPGIRYTGRLAGDPLGMMTLGEATIMNGSGVQRTTNSRWGDYTSMNIDPSDDCTFWYANEYYTLAGQQSSTAGWQTRIGSFKLPGCQ
jgi:hypothetical protein